MARNFKATFADGTVVVRTSESRVYSHAWRVRYEECWTNEAKAAGGWLTRDGKARFAGSSELAHRAAIQAMKSGRLYRGLAFEIVQVEVL